MKFEDILSNYFESNMWKWYWLGWKKFSYTDWVVTLYDFIESKKDEYWITLWKEFKKTISINDLLSLESWFLQACKWDNKSVSLLQYNWIDITFHRNYEDREYHAMILSILSQEEKIKYLENNIIIDEN